jgi:glycerophosphoryl diester phosphodiesterase
VRTAYLDHDGPIALAHRGFSREGLENSMAAFAAAVDLGLRYVETDVHATSDEVVVAFHDESLDRVTDRSGAITSLPWREVRRARIGGVEPVPTLEDLLGTWPQLRVNIDIKTPGAITPTVRVIERARAHDRVCIASFSDRRRRETLARLSRPVVTSAGRTTGALFRLATALPGAVRHHAVDRALRSVDGLQVPVQHSGIPLVTGATVRAAHRAGAFVHVWTVNDAAEMHRLLDLGVDGLVSDRADLLREVLLARGQWTG